MAENNIYKSEEFNKLFDIILSLETRDECRAFFDDLCTVKELEDMAQRVKTAQMLLDKKTYEQIVQSVEISTATISRINRCIQYGSGGYKSVLKRSEK